ncbi:MAG: sugar nucleotide-binding protein, partial [Candidatus Diapherotrites archaeon]|nr:sugar nucleotide-binding protein [Candidatus Diapherotrites archaeon]
MHNCLVIGYGLLGKKLAALLAARGIRFSIAGNDVGVEEGKIKLDITEKDAVEAVFAEKKPGVVFLTAAVSNVDFCEQNKEIAFAVNVEGAKNVALACKRHGSLLVFYSSDFVFNGRKGNYSEE